MKTSAKESLVLYEMKQHKQWFDEECSRFLYRRKPAKMQWLQNPNQNHGNNLDTVRRETSRNFSVKRKKEYLKTETDDTETNSSCYNIRDLYRCISDFKKSYQPRANIVK